MSDTPTFKGWANAPFTMEEWDTVTAIWHELVEEGKIVFGSNPPVSANIKALHRALSK